MREILFRGKAKDGKWYFGDLVQFNSGLVYIQSKEEGQSNYVKTETVGQYTGLIDKNGKKIFEGDILFEKPPMNKYGTTGKVVWDDKRGAWRFFIPEHPDYVAYLNTYGVEYKILGNIHDNPDLFKEGQANG